MPEPLPMNLFNQNPVVQNYIDQAHRVQRQSQHQPIPKVDPLASKGYNTLQRGQWVKH